MNTKCFAKIRSSCPALGLLGDVSSPRLFGNGESAGRACFDGRSGREDFVMWMWVRNKKRPCLWWLLRTDLYHTLIPSDHLSAKVQVNINEKSFRGYGLRYTAVVV